MPADKSTRRTKRRDFLHTFAAPRPKRWLIAALVPLNRWLCLGGIPGLRSVPLLDRIPGIGGIANVVRIDLPAADEQRLRSAVNDNTAAFIAPNHPEFFTDWMLDKEICTRIAPMTANWATHTVVNGMGRIMQRFWRWNNLIAQIPGSGGAAGKAYSVDWATQGHAVLLHPEGQVGWHNDHIGPLFGGVVDMALESVARLRELGVQREVYIAPIVWKLKFARNVEARLRREMTYVERKLELRHEPNAPLHERLHEAYAALLHRAAMRWGIGVSLSESYWTGQARLLEQLGAHLCRLLNVTLQQPASASTDAAHAYRGYRDFLAAAERHLREDAFEPPRVAQAEEADLAAQSARDDALAIIKDMRRVIRLRREMYPSAELTQENIAENIKRIRNDYCFGTLRDALNRFMPIPAGARIAYVRVPQPINVSEALRMHAAAPQLRERLLQELRSRMQRSLDEINAKLRARKAFVEYPNVFGAS